MLSLFKKHIKKEKDKYYYDRALFGNKIILQKCEIYRYVKEVKSTGRLVLGTCLILDSYTENDQMILVCPLYVARDSASLEAIEKGERKGEFVVFNSVAAAIKEIGYINKDQLNLKKYGFNPEKDSDYVLLSEIPYENFIEVLKRYNEHINNLLTVTIKSKGVFETDDYLHTA